MNPYNTDKYEHGFIDIYEPYFNSMSNINNILEIGVYFGGSLQYLSNKFKESNIYGIDIENKKEYETDKIKTFICDQGKREDLENFINITNVDFDIIIDDGGHTMKQQQISLGILFKKIKSGGIYILEDLHTSRLENFGTIHSDDLITSLDMLYNMKYTKKIISNHMRDDEKKYLEENIESITIWSASPENNKSVTSIIKKR